MKTIADIRSGVCEIQFKGVPSFFRYLVLDAAGRRRGVDYGVVGCELARHTYDFLDSNDETGEVDDHYGRLVNALEEEDDRAIVKWYREYLPQCLRLVPCKRLEKFVEGVRFAYEEGIMA